MEVRSLPLDTTGCLGKATITWYNGSAMGKKHTAEKLQPIISASKTWADVCRTLGVRPATGAQTHIKSVAGRFGIDYSHFVGQSWARGIKIGPKRPLKEYLRRSRPCKSSSLRDRLIREGIKEPRCERCGHEEWMDEKIPLELDHQNSNHEDNRLENLQILCANCHAQVTKKRRRSPNKVEAQHLECC